MCGPCGIHVHNHNFFSLFVDGVREAAETRCEHQLRKSQLPKQSVNGEQEASGEQEGAEDC